MSDQQSIVWLLLGVFVALYLFAKRYNESYMWIVSRVAIPGALTAAFIRFGNLFNSEILGKPSDAPWAIIFERIDLIPRHPVQLYEAFAYLMILLILVSIYRKVTPAFATKILPGTFLLLVTPSSTNTSLNFSLVSSNS